MAFIFYNYYKIEEEHLREQIYLEMRNYSFSFDDSRFDIDVVPKVDKSRLLQLYSDNKNLFIFIPIADNNTSIKVFYPISKYKMQLKDIKFNLLKQFLFFSFISILISILFALYTLHPLRKALFLLEEFIKDIIHDLNTPITSILINLKMMKKNEEVESIEQSANTIAMLHKNLSVYLKIVLFKKINFL